MIDFTLKQFNTKILNANNIISINHYDIINLINKNQSNQCEGFMTDTFIRPPLEIHFGLK